MAILKVNYTRSRAKMKATLRYIAHRPGREGERLTRVLFGHEGEMSKEEAYQMIDAEKGMTYFRIVLNFDPRKEDRRRDLDLRSITRQTILALEERLQRTIRFIAVEHNDHTALRHIHAIALIKLGRGEKLTREDFRALRNVATQKALFQGKARDLLQHYQLTRSYAQRYIAMAGGRARRRRKLRALTPVHSCSCGSKESMKRLKDGKYWCPLCGRVQTQSMALSL
jgi:hypothetical protein